MTRTERAGVRRPRPGGIVGSGLRREAGLDRAGDRSAPGPGSCRRPVRNAVDTTTRTRRHRRHHVHSARPAPAFSFGIRTGFVRDTRRSPPTTHSPARPAGPNRLAPSNATNTNSLVRQYRRRLRTCSITRTGSRARHRQRWRVSVAALGAHRFAGRPWHSLSDQAIDSVAVLLLVITVAITAGRHQGASYRHAGADRSMPGPGQRRRAHHRTIRRRLLGAMHGCSRDLRRFT